VRRAAAFSCAYKKPRDIAVHEREALWLAHQRCRWMLPDPSHWLQPDQRRFQPPQPYERKYSDAQPRVPAGNPDGGQWMDAGRGSDGGDSSATETSGGNNDADQSRTQVAGTVIRVCVAGSHSLTTVDGIKTYQVTYECTGGRSFIKSGFGHDFKRIILDPFQ
jgi:hypothetical protein